MYECPNCGGNLKFDIPSQELACAYCGTKRSPYEINKEQDAKEQEFFEATIFTCPQCGGEILSTDNEAATFCSFCGASTILSSRLQKEKRPGYIIPFKKTKEDCKKAYEKKLRKAFFVPKELKRPEYIDSFRGIYMPYWTYQIEQKRNISLEGKTVQREGDYIVTKYYQLKGKLDARQLGYAYDASTSFDDDISQALAPYDAKELVNFTPAFLSGFYADTADVDQSEYLEEAYGVANRNTFENLCKEKEFKGYGVRNEKNADNLQEKLGTTCKRADSTMYPVWFLSYRYKDRVAYATVNGQTGKVVADLPIEPVKYILCSLLLALPIFFFLNMFFTLKPPALMGLCALLAVAASAVYITELRGIYERRGLSPKAEEQEEQSKEKKKGKKTKKKKEKKDALSWAVWGFVILICAGPALALLSLFLWPCVLIGMIVCCIVGFKEYKKAKEAKGVFGFVFCLIAVLICAMIKLLDPVSDLYYYTGAMLALAAELFSFVDIIRNYNKLAMRRLPQFDKKGGDDRA